MNLTIRLWEAKYCRSGSEICVVDLELFISDPDPTCQAISDPNPGLTCRIHTDLDPTF